MSNPLFSILIANYNNGKYFEDCYKSLLAQTYPNWEAIIVDDCSSDNSLELIKKLIGVDNRFKLFVNEENHGCGYTKRRCAELAKGELCGFVDPDDAITPDALEVMVKAHQVKPGCGLIYSTFNYCDEQLKPKKIYPNSLIESNRIPFFNTEYMITAFSSYKKSIYNLTEGIAPDLKRAVDQDLYIKLYEVAPVFYIASPLYQYRIHSGGISTSGNEEKALYWHWKVIENAAGRQNISVEQLFTKQFVRKSSLDRALKKIEILKKSRWLRIGYYLRLFKGYKYL